MTWELVPFGVALVACSVGGFFVGQRMSRGMVRARELESELEDLRKEHDIALAEVEAAKHEWKRTQDQLDRFREDVTDHFSGTSELLRDLTLQYRAVYDHLTTGARSLCPEASLQIDRAEEAGFLPPTALPEAQAGANPVPEA